MPQYGWNTAKVGIKHQLINPSKFEIFPFDVNKSDIIIYLFFLEDIFSRNSLKKTHQEQTNNKFSTYKKYNKKKIKTFLSHWEPLVWKRIKLWSPKSIPTLYSEPRIFVLKTQDWSTRTKIIAQKQCVYRQTDRQWKTQNKVWFRFMVFNVTFNNISVVSWPLVLLVEETGVSGENHQPAVSHWQTLSHNIVSSTSHHEWD